eukprot:Seg14268.1 transcript_id=Seg14268.1/GoldUCD/mRNA.D3Y31 product="hypothetical protein" protein_id=Seg14268.1/GoldUCD/D3Y31
MTIGNIISECERHFTPKLGKDVVCDVLAGEQGPSCSLISLLPDTKVIHVRFVPAMATTASDANNPGIPSQKRAAVKEVHKGYAGPSMKEPPVTWSVTQNYAKYSPTKFKRPATSAAEDYQVKVPKTVEFCEEKTAVGRGGFRTTYKASPKHPDFKRTSWVVKHYLPGALKCIEETGQTIEEHSKKVVQMHLLARNITLQLEQAVRKTEDQDLFGEVPKYKKIIHGVTEAGKNVTIEEYIKGSFVKYINNDGTISQIITGEAIEKLE